MANRYDIAGPLGEIGPPDVRDQDTFSMPSCSEPGLVYSPEAVRGFQAMEIPHLVTNPIADHVVADPDNGTVPRQHHGLMRHLGVVLTPVVIT